MRLPSGLTTTPSGPDPTTNVVITVLVAASITDTLLLLKLVT